MYVDPNILKVESVRGKLHKYLPMKLYYTTKVEVKIDIQKCVKNMIDKFSIRIEKSQAVTIPTTDKLFKVDGSNPLKNNKKELFHTTLARGLFLCKWARPDIQTTIDILCT